jgi:hypothetical protein
MSEEIKITGLEVRYMIPGRADARIVNVTSFKNPVVKRDVQELFDDDELESGKLVPFTAGLMWLEGQFTSTDVLAIGYDQLLMWAPDEGTGHWSWEAMVMSFKTRTALPLPRIPHEEAIFFCEGDLIRAEGYVYELIRGKWEPSNADTIYFYKSTGAFTITVEAPVDELPEPDAVVEES